MENRQNFIEVKPRRERVKTVIVKLFFFVFAVEIEYEDALEVLNQAYE